VVRDKAKYSYFFTRLEPGNKLEEEARPMGVTLLIVRQKPQPQKVPSQPGGCDDAGHCCAGDKRCCKTSKMDVEININLKAEVELQDERA